MTRSHLRRNLFLVTVVFLAYCVAYACTYVTHPHVANVLKTLLPVVLAIPAPWLAGSFSRRNSYAQALRDLWRHLIPAVQTAIQYTRLAPPSHGDHAKTIRELATAIDMLHGIFSNIPTGRLPGLYPYENLKDIEKTVRWLGYGPRFRAEEAAMARSCITRLWQEMHVAMLAEFDRDVPLKPVSKYLGRFKMSVADLLFTGRLEGVDLLPDNRASRPLEKRTQEEALGTAANAADRI